LTAYDDVIKGPFVLLQAPQP